LIQANCRPYLPPEWADQSGVMLTWPHDRGDWGSDLFAAETVFVDMVTAITRYQPALITCRNEAHRQHVQQLLAACPTDRIFYGIAESNDVWSRDHGPLTVICQNEPVLLNFRFNGWGGKHAADHDDAITATLYRLGMFDDTAIEDVNLVLEGGAVEVDGSGSLLATRSSIITDTRNAGMTQAEIEKVMAERFGIHRFLWLDHGRLEGDDTDGHIDTLARFADRETILYVSCEDKSDTHYAELEAMRQALERMQSVTGQPYKLVPLPLPAAKYNDNGCRLPATYANFLIINGAVLLPTYDDPNDAVMIRTFKSIFPERDIIPINCIALIQQFGSLHCATMQLPKGVVLHKSG
jgi:agmatine deiminase